MPELIPHLTITQLWPDIFYPLSVKLARYPSIKKLYENLAEFDLAEHSFFISEGWELVPSH